MFFHEYIVLFLLAIGLLNASALLHLSPYCREGTVVSVVNEDAPAQFAITLDNGPTPAAGVTVIIMPLPGKLDEWQAIPFRKIAVDESDDRYKLDASISIIIEGDVCRPEQIQIIAAPHFHLFNAPVPGKSPVYFQGHLLCCARIVAWAMKHEHKGKER